MTEISVGEKHRTIRLGVEMTITDDEGFVEHLESIGLNDRQIEDIFANYKVPGSLWGYGVKDGYPTFNAYDELGRTHLWSRGWHVSDHALRTERNIFEYYGDYQDE